MNRIRLSMLLVTMLASSSLLAQGDAFSYAKGVAGWSNTKADYLTYQHQEKPGGKDFGMFGLDFSNSFNNLFYGRTAGEYHFNRYANNGMGLYSAGVGVFTGIHDDVSIYGETGVMGYRMQSKRLADVKGDNVTARNNSAGAYGEVGLRHHLGQVELSTAYRYAKMTRDMNEYKLGVSYHLTSAWALTTDYSYRHWDLQKGSIVNVGVKYTF